MEAFSIDTELLPIQNLFLQGLHKRVIDFPVSTISQSAQLPAQVLRFRSQIARNDIDSVQSSVGNDAKYTPPLAAVKALATYARGEHDEAVKMIEDVLGGAGAEDAQACLLCGLVLAMSGKVEEAVQVTGRAKDRSLEAVHLLTQLHLLANHTSAAQSLIAVTRRTAPDSDALPLALASAYLALRQGTAEKLQSAFYVFEELAQSPAAAEEEDGAVKMAVCQAVSEILLGRTDEAVAGLGRVVEKIQGKEKSMEGAIEGLVNNVVLGRIEGNDVDSTIEKIRMFAPDHPFITDIDEKSSLFDQAASKYRATNVAA